MRDGHCLFFSLSTRESVISVQTTAQSSSGRLRHIKIFNLSRFTRFSYGMVIHMYLSFGVPRPL
jgi:hypothetical protein